jgi:t-SNARE complex subunit (syntaxin)
MAAAGSGGAVPIKAPTLAFNTLDSAIDNSIDSLLGDPAIPKPVYNVSNKAAKAAGDKLTGVSEEKVKAALDLNEIYANARKLELKSKTAKKKYETAELQLPQGSPELTKLKEEYNQSLKAIQDYETETVPVQESLLKIINS